MRPGEPRGGLNILVLLSLLFFFFDIFRGSGRSGGRQCDSQYIPYSSYVRCALHTKPGGGGVIPFKGQTV